MTTNNTNTNTRPAACMQCHTLLLPGEGIAAAVKSDGNKSRYICHACERGYNDSRYHTAKASGYAQRGKQAGHGITYGVELELHAPDTTARAELAKVGFRAERDCTTDAEFVSPIWQNFNNAKTWRTVEQLVADGHAAIAESDGTHVHMSAGFDADDMHAIRAFGRELFGGLYTAMDNDRLALRALFGRDFNDYAGKPSGKPGESRYEAINITNNRTIEWRLTKFKTAAQFRAVLKFEKAATECLAVNFAAHYRAGVRGCRLRHKAEVTGAKLVKLYIKHSMQALTR